MQIDQVLNTYYMNDASKLHGIVDKILLNFGGIYEKDRDDFYSIANEVMTNVCHTYDKVQNFDGYVYSCLANRMKTEITRRNREKRRADRQTISIDTPVDGTEGLTIADTLVSDFDIEREVFFEVTVEEPNMQRFLDRLSKMQRRVVKLTAAGYKSTEIQELLQITGQQYSDSMRAIQSYENTKILM